MFKINRNTFASEWSNLKASIEQDNRKLSAVRAGELAAARLVAEVEVELRRIENAVCAHHPITDEDEALYDDCFCNGWNPKAEAIALSGTRTLILDLDDLADVVSRIAC